MVTNIVKCGGVLFSSDKKRLVIVHQLYNGVPAKWGAPKGHRKKNELYHKCAAREIYEELGIKIHTHSNDPKIKVGNTVYFPYIVRNISDNMVPVDKNEICEICLIDIENVDMTMNMNYELKKIIENIDVFRDRAILSHF